MKTVHDVGHPWMMEVEVASFIKRQALPRGWNAAVRTSAFALNSVAMGYTAEAFWTTGSTAAALGTLALCALGVFSAKRAYKAFKSYLKMDALKYSMDEGMEYFKRGGDEKIFLRRTESEDGVLEDLSFRTECHELSKDLGEYREKDLTALKYFMVFLGIVGACMGMEYYANMNPEATDMPQQPAAITQPAQMEELGH